MEQTLKRLLSFPEVTKHFHLALKSKSVIENFYPLAVLGHICGFLPVQNLLPNYYQGVNNLKFTWLSYPILYTIIVNLFLYFFTIEASLSFYKDAFHFKFSTDDFALKVFFFAYSLTKVACHFLTILKASKIINCFKTIEKYDICFSHRNGTLILNRYVIIFLVGSGMSAVLNLVVAFSSTWAKVEVNYDASSRGRGDRFWSLTIVPEPLTVTILSLFTHVIADSAIFFAQSTVAYIVNCICDRMKSIETDILELQQRSLEEFDRRGTHANDGGRSDISQTADEGQERVNTIWIQSTKFSQDNLANELKTRGKRDARKFRWLMDIVQDLNDIATEIVLVYTTSATVITVSLGYLIVIFGSAWKSSGHVCGDLPVSVSIDTTFKDTDFIVSSTVFLILGLNIGRLINFANTGEKLQNSVIKLKTAMTKFDHTENPETTRICIYMWHLTSTADASLSGWGFFRLNRAALTSIVAPVITFIVILAQFRASDMQSWSDQNSTATAILPFHEV